MPTWLQIVREKLPSGSASLRINIDATVKGNVARFINHRQVAIPPACQALFLPGLFSLALLQSRRITKSYSSTDACL